MNFSNLKIGSRLALAFSVVIALLLVVLGVAISVMNGLSHSMEVSPCVALRAFLTRTSI